MFGILIIVLGAVAVARPLFAGVAANFYRYYPFSAMAQDVIDESQSAAAS